VATNESPARGATRGRANRESDQANGTTFGGDLTPNRLGCSGPGVPLGFVHSLPPASDAAVEADLDRYITAASHDVTIEEAFDFLSHGEG